MKALILFSSILFILATGKAQVQAPVQAQDPEPAQTQTPPALAAAPAAASDEPELMGDVDGDRYVSATGLFSIRIPIIKVLGGTIKDQTSSVTFHDDFTTHITVAAFALSSEAQTELAAKGKKAFLPKFFAETIMPSYLKLLPGSNWQKGRFINDVRNGAFFFQTTLPGGSTFQARTTLFGRPSDPVVVAKRGNLMFVQGNNVILISSELGARSTEGSFYGKTDEQDDEILRQRLLELAASMDFPSASSAPAAAPAAAPSEVKIAVPGTK